MLRVEVQPGSGVELAPTLPELQAEIGSFTGLAQTAAELAMRRQRPSSARPPS